MSSERNIWQRDDDPAVAAHETAMTRIHQMPIMGMHADLHRLLGLPPIARKHVEQAYKMPASAPLRLIAKAEGDPDRQARQRALSTAYARFQRLAQQGQLVPEHAGQIADTLAEKWYGEGRLKDEGEARAVRAYVAGRIQENPRGPTPARLPATWHDAHALYRMDEPTQNALRWGAAHTAEHVQDMHDRAKGRIRELVLVSQMDREDPDTLAHRMLDSMATLNRDWRRIALTETHANMSHGRLAALVGQQVRWTAASDACPYCRRYAGRVFDVLPPNSPARDHHKNVWPGKTNVGRSFHPRTIDGRYRTPDELAGPTIPSHPNCRCSWARVLARARTQADPRLTEFIRKRLAA